MSNEIRFIGSAVNCYTENDVIIIGVGDDSISPRNYIVISRFDDGEIDNSIGIQTHLSEIEIPNAIEKVALCINNLVVTIRPKKEHEVNASIIDITLSDNGIDYSLLKKYLHDIFHGSSTNLIISI